MSVIFDCETYRVQNAADYLDPIVVPPVKADGRLTDAAKIAADLEKKEAARLQELAEKTQEQLDACALYPYLSRIVSLAWKWHGDQLVTVRPCRTESQEAEALREFWAVTVDPSTRGVVPLIGYNSLAFDCPLLVVRSMLLGVKAPILNLDKYRSPHKDVMLALTFNGVIKMRSLGWYAKRFGLPTDDTFSGKEIAQLVESDNFDAIEKHNVADVTLTEALAERVGILRPRA